VTLTQDTATQVQVEADTNEENSVFDDYIKKILIVSIVIEL